MGFRIEERFEVDAPIDTVWAFLIDPRQVVVCLPGAEVTDVVDDRSYEGRVHVRVGPVTAKYKGLVTMDEIDAGTRRVRMVGEGKEMTGGGSAKMSMTGRLATSDAGLCVVSVESDVDISGKMAKFGRGVIEDVARQLFREFAANMQEALSASTNASEIADAAADGGAERASDAVSMEHTDHTERPSGSTSANDAIDDDHRDDARRPAGRTSSTSGARHAGSGDPPATPMPLNAVGLLFRAMWSGIKRLLGR